MQGQVLLLLRLTGLMAITPDSADPVRGPTYVLMPQWTQSVGEHRAQLGYNARDLNLRDSAGNLKCAYKEDAHTSDGICWHDIGDMSVTFQGSGAGTTLHHMPNHALNLRTDVGVPGKIPSDADDPMTRPDTYSRAVLPTGGTIGTCESGGWTGPGSARSDSETHVVLWQSYLAEEKGKVVLRASPIHSSGPGRVIAEFAPPASNILELVIRYVPLAESNGPYDSGPHPATNVSASHFQALYEYAGIQSTTYPHANTFVGYCDWHYDPSRFLPPLTRALQPSAPDAARRQRDVPSPPRSRRVPAPSPFILVAKSPGTATCLVGVGGP